jgi:hypothetical protein
MKGGCLLTDSHPCSDASHGEFVQADVLDGGPDNCQATRLCRKHINLISPLPHEAPQTLDGIGRLNVSMHRGRKRIKRQEMLFILCQASHRFWIALMILRFEGRQLCQGFLLAGLLPDANEFGLHLAPLSSRNGIQDVVYGLRTS